jgi:hypothetical protein
MVTDIHAQCQATRPHPQDRACLDLSAVEEFPALEQPKFVRSIDMSPDGAGIVVSVAGKEAFLPADKAAEWISEMGYTVLSPLRISVGVEPTLRQGDVQFVSEERMMADIISPEALAWLSEYLKKHPAELSKLRARGMPQGWPDND